MRKESSPITRREFLKIAGSAFGSVLPEMNLGSYVPLINHGDYNSNCVALTFDDGWNDEYVRLAIELLGEDQASFFIVGNILDSHLNTYASALDMGHGLYNHTWSHADMSKLSDSEKIKEIVMWEIAYAKLKKGLPEKLLRLPGYNGVNDQSIYRVASQMEYRAIVSSSRSSLGVYPGHTSSEISDKFRNIRGGDIVLMHFTATDVYAIPLIKDIVAKSNLKLVSLKNMPGMPIYEVPVKFNDRLTDSRYLKRE